MNLLPMYERALVFMAEGIPLGEALSIAQLGPVLGKGVPPFRWLGTQEEKKKTLVLPSMVEESKGNNQQVPVKVNPITIPKNPKLVYS
jgi:hypothetical protein